ncbi:MAG: 4-hydroxythreonine-4-phosphate dehydrogenase [Campylobacterota bacterium]|nr:4-hydroxythreonine-4-phosphate dehydrogenase [Campylobacterota bacterium]
MVLKKVAVSIGDINGVGIQLALENHSKVKKLCNPIYCIDKKLLVKAVKRLSLNIPKDFTYYGKYKKCEINPSEVRKDSGRFSYDSFKVAINLAKQRKVDAITTLPVNKESWSRAGIDYVGHTDMLRDVFKKDAIMMLGCDKMFVALYTEHIPLKDVPKNIKVKKLISFLLDFYDSIGRPNEHIAILGLNPHAGDNGVLGDEEEKIKKAIKKVNSYLAKTFNLQSSTFTLQVPDIAFTPHVREQFKYFVAMYHDQGLAPLKALYFEESINVSLNLPIIRTSVDHGTAFDISYKKENNLSSKSYINAVKKAVELAEKV